MIFLCYREHVGDTPSRRIHLRSLSVILCQCNGEDVFRL